MLIVANDATVKGGTYFPLTVKKHLRAQEVAEQNRLPCIYLVDSGGAFLPLQAEVFPDREHFGRIFYNQARMSAAGHSADRRRHGLVDCGRRLRAGDERRDGHRARHRHDLHRRAAARESGDRRRRSRAEELGGADVHTRVSRVWPTTTRRATSTRSRSRGASSRHAHTRKPEPPWTRATPELPAVDPSDLYGLIQDDHRTQMDAREVIARIVDGIAFDEFKALYGETLVCGLRTSRAIRSGSSPTTASSSRKAPRRARTSSSCAASAAFRSSSCRTSPASWSARSTRHGGIAQDGAKLVMAVAVCRVPKFTVIIGGSFGAGNYGMCGRAYSPRQLWMWPNARISVMGGEQAATVCRWSATRIPTRSAPSTRRKETLLLDSAALGRRDHRSTRHAARPRARDLGGAERTDP